MDKKCPICKKKMINVFDGLDNFDGHKCSEGHYEFSDSGGVDGGFAICVGKRTMNNLYSGSVRKCRLQNIIIKNWIQRERKKILKNNIAK